MAFIEKKDPVVLNIKLTSKGRELLSKGRLTFRYFAVGDSEIDYQFDRNAPFNPFYANILRPADQNPLQLSYVTRNLSGDSFNEISAVPCTPTIVENHVPAVGFFEGDAVTFLIDTDHVKQPDAMVVVSGITGGTQLLLNKAPYYQANANEPAEGDLLLVKWTNPTSIHTTGYTVNTDFPTPYLFYKIQSIVSGSLAGDNLIIEVDRDLPNFSGVTGGSNSILAGAMIYYNFINYTGDTCYSTDETDDALIAFLQNCQCPTVTFPFWNMSIVFTENIVGVDVNDKQYGEYNTVGFGGFVSYIQNQAKSDPNYINKLGVIHYTNNSVANTYAEGFYGDALNEADADKIPTLDVPTIMWHKSTGATLGARFKASGDLKYLTGVTHSLNAKYYDLADDSGYVVGKVFYGLKIFVIEDQELLFAMSYKSNRSWTLPEHNVDINANVTFGCPDCVLEYLAQGVPPTNVGGSDGAMRITGITNVNGELILEIISGGTGITGGVQVYYNTIPESGITVTNADTINGWQFSAITYTVKLSDLGAPNCTIIEEEAIPEPVSLLSVDDSGSTYSTLNAYFHVPAFNNNPTNAQFFTGNSTNSIAGVGDPLGVAYMTVGPTGMTNTDLQNRYVLGAGTLANDVFTKWVLIDTAGLSPTNFSFGEPYAIYVRDATGSTFSEIGLSPVINSQVWSYYVAVGNPLRTDGQDIILNIGQDGGGTYVWVSDYLRAINPNSNPIVGNIEMSVHEQGVLPVDWQPAVNNAGGATKLYFTYPVGQPDMNVSIRERFGYVVMYQITSDDF